MTTMRHRDLDPVHAAVNATVGQVGPGLYGVACSGGADSLALAHAAIAVAGPTNVIVITIDHGLSAGSADIASRVASWANRLGAAAVVRKVRVPERASIEAAARDVRYEALDALAHELGLAAAFLGHTARDQAETVLMRILRGTGPAGLAGIPPRRGIYHRPLLGLPRAAIDAYCAAHALTPWEDPMNHDDTIARVRMRDSILPMLREENPRVDAALVRLAASAAEWTEVIDALAAPFARFPIDCVGLAQHPAAVQKRALALALEHAGLGYDAVHLDVAEGLVMRRAAGTQSIDLPGARLVRTYDLLGLVIVGATPNPPSPTGTMSPPRTEAHAFRTWRSGDRMRPARLKGRSKKLSDLFIDAKVPRDVRASARVLVRTVDGSILWAEHIGVAHGESPELVANLLGKPA